jgi:hypothetical protein
LKNKIRGWPSIFLLNGEIKNIYILQKDPKQKKIKIKRIRIKSKIIIIK